MKAIPLCIHQDTGAVRRTLTGGVVTATAILGTALELSVTFYDDDNEAVELPEGTTGKLACRAPDALDGDDVLNDGSWDHTTDTTIYTLKTLANSEQLEALIKSEKQYILSAQIEFQFPDEDAPRKSLPFDLTIINGPACGDSGAPDVAGAASSAWLSARSPRIDVDEVITAGQRTRLLTNIGNAMQMRLSDDADYLHLYTPDGIYKGSLALVDLGKANL